MPKFLICHLCHKFVQRDLSFCNFHKNMCVFLIRLWPDLMSRQCADSRWKSIAFLPRNTFDCGVIRIIRFGLRQFFKTSIGEHALRKWSRNQFCTKLLCYGILWHCKTKYLLCFPHGRAKIKLILTFFQHIGRFLNFSQIIIGCKLCHRCL